MIYHHNLLQVVYITTIKLVDAAQFLNIRTIPVRVRLVRVSILGLGKIDA